MKKSLIYIVSFIAVFIIMILCVFILLAIVVGFISFVAWSLPDISVLGWLHFRILSGIAFLLATFWSFSKENKEFVEETLRVKMKNEWSPRNKYEVAPGLSIGSEIGDIDREVKILMRKYVQENDREALIKIKSLHASRTELLKPKTMRKK